MVAKLEVKRRAEVGRGRSRPVRLLYSAAVPQSVGALPAEQLAESPALLLNGLGALVCPGRLLLGSFPSCSVNPLADSQEVTACERPEHAARVAAGLAGTGRSDEKGTDAGTF